MNQLVQHVETVLQKRLPAIRIPYAIGMAGGYCLDALAWLLRRKFAISAVRVKKFCATTEYDATRMQQTGFKPPYTLADDLHGLLNSNSSIPAATKSPTKRNNPRLRLLDFRNCRYFNTIYRYVFNE